MNKYFKVGFMKTADPVLTSESDQGNHWDNQSDYRFIRQKALERLTVKDKNDKDSAKNNNVLSPDMDTLEV